MSDSGTNFPPQTYSSIFNLNVMPEGDNSAVRPVSSIENEPKETEKSRMRDCFTSSMERLIIIMTTLLLVNKFPDTAAFSCALDAASKTRVFETLVEFQGNKISFDSRDQTYQGSNITFKFQNITRLPKNSFIVYTSEFIRTLKLGNKSIKYIDDGAFTSLKCLDVLDLNNNLISNLTTDMFLGLDNVRTLNMRKNNLSYVPSNVFSNMKGLVYLDMSFNNISETNSTAFEDNTALEILDLSHNSMKHISGFFSNKLTRLRELYLDHNSIAMMYTSTFNKNKLLAKLDMSGNELVLLYLINNSFNPEAMQVFNLSNNCLSNINVTDFVNQFSNSKTIIDLNNNQFYCDQWEQNLEIFRKSNVSIAPGRNSTARSHIDGMLCDYLNFSLPHDYHEALNHLHIDLSDDKLNGRGQNTSQDLDQKHRLIQTMTISKSDEEPTHMSSKYVIIALTVIGAVFCVFLGVDYILGAGLRQSLTQRFRTFLSPTQTNTTVNTDYVQLESAS